MIFFSTLGGLLLFGFMGFIIGPIIAALFVTVWELYGYEFSRWLPTTAYRPYKGRVVLPHEKYSASTYKGKSSDVAQKVAEAKTGSSQGGYKGAAKPLDDGGD